jgi:hypothetical protein
MKIFPNEEKIEIITDGYFNGKSEILKYNKLKNKIECKYIIRKGFDYPFVGICFSYFKDSGIDISTYNNITIIINSPDTDKIDIRLMYYKDKNSKREDYISYIIKSHEIPIDNKARTYDIKLKNFKIPMWYYFLNKDINSKNEKYFENQKKIVALEIYNSQTQPLDKQSTLEITHISLNKKYPLLFNMIFYIVLTIYYMALIIFLIFNRQIKNILINLNLVKKHLDISAVSDKEFEKIVKYTQDNFNNSELTINGGFSEYRNKGSQNSNDYKKKFEDKF